MTYAQNVEILGAAIRKTVAGLRREGTVGMSRRNLMMMVPTRGLDLPNANAYERAFDEALGQINFRNFEVYQ